MKIAGIYLAGGNSRRMGTSKLALPVGTMTLGSIALETVLQSSLESVYVIVQQSDNLDWLPSSMKSHHKSNIIHCSNAFLGQAESLRCGIEKALENKMDAVIIFLADQPFITVQMIDNMIACILNSPISKYVATSYEKTTYPPVLYTSQMFPSLLKITGDRGGKALLNGDLLKYGIHLPCEDQRLVFDIDTKEDYELFLKRLDHQ